MKEQPQSEQYNSPLGCSDFRLILIRTGDVRESVSIIFFLFTLPGLFFGNLNSLQIVHHSLIQVLLEIEQ